MTQLAVLLAVTAAVPLLGLWVWAVVRTGDRNTPTPDYATGGVIDRGRAARLATEWRDVTPREPLEAFKRLAESARSETRVEITGALLTDKQIERLLAEIKRQRGDGQDTA